MALIKLQQKEYGYFHRFRLPDNSVQEVRTTEADYLQLGKLNPKNPVMVGATWECSYETPEFDTPSGKLSDNQYGAVAARTDLQGKHCSSYYMVKLLNYSLCSVALEDIVNDELTTKGLEQIKLNNKS